MLEDECIKADAATDCVLYTVLCHSMVQPSARQNVSPREKVKCLVAVTLLNRVAKGVEINIDPNNN